MTFIQRFIRWINSRNLTVWRRSSSSVSPSIPVSSNSIYKSESSSAGYFSSSNSSTRQVHFADNRGEPLECVHEIPSVAPSGKPFQENLEGVYIDERNFVTGFLKVTHLKAGRKLFVKYTTNDWKSHTTVATRLTSKPSKKPGRRRVKTEVNEECDDGDTPCENVLTYYFEFKINRTEADQLKLVVISTLDGVTDQRHDKSYSLHYPRCNAGNATNGRVDDCGE